MFEVCTLASGSSGNCLVMSDGGTHILVDAGISARRITKALRELGIEPSELSGILITHEHSDHISGLTTLTKQLGLPVFASKATAMQLCYRIAFLEPCIRSFETGTSFDVGSFGVETYATPHDVAGSVGYAVSSGGRKAAVVTDLGHVTDEVYNGVKGAELVVCEANHDEEWLKSGPYPYYLKARILGQNGHLSNEAGGTLARWAVDSGAVTVVLAHLSNENNTPARAYDTVRRCLESGGVDVDQDILLEVAPRSECGRRYVVGERKGVAPCSVSMSSALEN